MSNRHNLPVNGLLILISLLAVAGGVATVLVTSPLSFNLAQSALLQAIIAPDNTPTATATPSSTLVPPSPTVAPTATASQPSISLLPTGTGTPTPQPSSTAGSSATATATATNVLMAPDVWALAVVSTRVGSQLVRVHDSPNGDVIVAVIPGGTVVQVLYGSAVVDGVEWLPVRLGTGRGGWVAGYLLTITLARPGGTGTAEGPGTETPTDTPQPATAQPGSTNHAPPPTPPPSATPNPTDTAVNLATVAQTSHPVIRTNTPPPPPPSNTPVTPPPSTTPASPGPV